MENNVKYLLGDYAKKRRFMRAGVGYIYADNDEVCRVVRLGGQDYFYTDKHPFAEFTAKQYADYISSLSRLIDKKRSRLNQPAPSLEDKTALNQLSHSQVEEIIRQTHFRPSNKKIKSLSVLEVRLLTILARYECGKQIRINLDGWEFSPKNKANLSKLVKILRKYSEVWVAVSDPRFLMSQSKR